MGKLKWLFTEGVTDLTSYRLGQVQERERIIKLLEGDKRMHSYFYAEQSVKSGEPLKPFVETHAPDCPSCDLIALIKGENK